jgi:hypothetical protein
LIEIFTGRLHTAHPTVSQVAALNRLRIFPVYNIDKIMIDEEAQLRHFLAVFDDLFFSDNSSFPSVSFVVELTEDI